MGINAPALKFAILQNFTDSSPVATDIIARFTELIRKSQPDAIIDVFRPIEGEVFPDLSSYSLVILTGGKFNLLVKEQKPVWVEDTLEYIRKTAVQSHGPKLLGICWGHQAIAYALGGSLATRTTGPRIGVETICLNREGSTFFNEIDHPGHTVNVHKFHLRYVATCSVDFTPLADNNEILISSSRRILSFQGHPELQESLSRGLLDGDDGIYGSNPTADPRSSVKDIKEHHDGPELFKRIVAWACTI